LEEKDFELMLQKVSALDGVVSAYVCSRAGNYVLGNTPKYADRNMYSAITSLAYGTAEQVGHEMNDDLRYVSLRFSEKNLLVVDLGPAPSARAADRRTGRTGTGAQQGPPDDRLITSS